MEEKKGHVKSAKHDSYQCVKKLEILARKKNTDGMKGTAETEVKGACQGRGHRGT